MSDPRFSIIPAGAVLDTRLEARDLQVLCVFGKHTDRKGWCHRSQVVMAREMRCARSTVQASIDRLVAAGWLQRRPANDVHTPGIRDSAHEYRVVLDTGEDPLHVVGTPADLSAPLPTKSENESSRGPDSGHRHPPAPPAGPENAGVSGVQNGNSSAPMLTTPSNESSPQPPETGGQGFASLLEKWPVAHRGNLENAQGTFNRLSADEQVSAIRAAETTVSVLSVRKQRIPSLKSYLSARVFVEYDGAPAVDIDGDFIIKPDRPEWSAWLGSVRKALGEPGVQRAIKPGYMLRKSRWPEGHVAHTPPLRDHP